MFKSLRALARWSAATSIVALSGTQGLAQGAPEQLPLLVITATRSPLAIQRAGSAISVVEGSEIASWGAKSLPDVLRQVPGLDITENGGAGSLSYVRLRGAEARQTLVLIDNVRVGDAAGTGGEMDMSNISPDDIQRIEVLRGPQSALYGSDAMGGVINIITKRGARTPRSGVTMEAGSYGTIAARAFTSGATDTTSWAFSISNLHTDGFSRFGYRIGRITSTLPGPLETDSTDRLGGSARITHRLGETAEVEIGFRRTRTIARVDNPGAFASPRDTTFDKGEQTFTTLYAKISADSFGGRMRNSLTVFTNWLDRLNRVQQGCFDNFFNSYDCNYIFRSRRVGAEYQGDIDFASFGKTIVGARTEYEEASNRESWLAPVVLDLERFTANQRTNSAFVLHQLPLGNLDLSLGGRIDSVDGKNVFPTWRATAAYLFAATGTKLRASAGTGAKAPSLFQRFSQYGTPGLRPEYNIGYDFGIDQKLFDGRATLSATVFDTRYRDLFDFDPLGNNFVGAYINVGRARITGLEVSGEAVLVPDEWKMRVAYTRLRAVDQMRQLPLLRRPRDSAYVSATYTGITNLEIEARATFVGRRIDVQNDFPFSRVKMAPYGKVDMRAAYKVNDRLSIFARAENITNARYQEIRDYGTPGRSYYAGMTVTW
jgi:vitamin B12 transporter